MFTQRSVDVRVRDNSNQENRAGAFPKTPAKNVIGAKGNLHNNVQSSKAPPVSNFTTKQFDPSAFVTPAPNHNRAPLGAKSTNVNNRQFASASKTGKRHSPKTIARPPKLQIALDEPVVEQEVPQPVSQQPKLSGIEALRLALDRSIETGIDLPDIEYMPPKVVERPYNMEDEEEPFTYEISEAENRAAQKAYIRSLALANTPADDLDLDLDLDLPPVKLLPEPIFVKKGTANPSLLAKSTSTQTGRSSSSLKPKVASEKIVPVTRPTRLGGFAAPTASARAKATTRPAQLPSTGIRRPTSTTASRAATSRQQQGKPSDESLPLVVEIEDERYADLDNLDELLQQLESPQPPALESLDWSLLRLPDKP
ncbi:hypothetical protein PYCC9005_000525 [Savitreella phatthalungensis]